MAAIETCAKELAIPVELEGYPPPDDPRLGNFKVTPDPGVIEVNVPFVRSFPELVAQTELLYEEARAEHLVAGFRPELWQQTAPADAPPNVQGFNHALLGIDGFTMPATQHDAMLWISGSSYDVVFDVAHSAIAALKDLAHVAEETSSWPYRHDRDLTGFIDGSENPSLIDAGEVALIPEGQPGGAAPFADWV